MAHTTSLAPMGRTVFILGAGFSRAISAHMPLTDELGKLVVDSLPEETIPALNSPIFSTEGLSFEAWLSWMAEKQPYESESDFHSRFAQFLILQSEIANVVRRRQALAEEAPFPVWLYELIDLLHHAEATVVTLNYDTLLESAFSLMSLTDQKGDVTQRSDLTKVFPKSIGMTYGGQFGPLRANGTLDLFKLHGSINWYWVPKDMTGATLEVIEDAGGSEIEVKARRASMAEKTEFIVPPTSSKNEYFENPKTRYLWQESYRALTEANLVVLLGYSLPLNDSALASMLSRGLSKSEAAIVVVNPEGGTVAGKLKALGITSDRIAVVAGPQSIKEFVSLRKSETAKWVVEKLQTLGDARNGAPIAVGWSEGQIAAVTGSSFDRLSGVLTLTTSSLAGMSELHRPGVHKDGNRDSANLTFGQLIGGGSSLDIVSSIEVDIPDHGTWTLGGFVDDIPGILPDTVSEGRDNWIILRPIGQIPRT
jgi:hypothetical protein